MKTMTKLTTEEAEALARLEDKYETIRVNTMLVANGDSSGLAVWGEGGIGKSYQITHTLDQGGKKYHLHNTRLTGPGLCKILQAHPKDLHIIEDVESVFGEKICMSLLRSACWGQEDAEGKMKRLITYRTANDSYNFHFDFDGAIIVTLNGNISNIPELRALKTRIDVYHLRSERDEVFALAKKIALDGYATVKGVVPPEQCLEMWAFYKEHLPESHSPDLRMLTRAYRKWLGLKGINTTKTWQSLLLAAIQEGSEKKATSAIQLEDIAAGLREKHGKKNWRQAVEEWTKLTDQGKSSYYKALERFDRR